MKSSCQRNIKWLLLAMLAATSLTWQSGVVYAEEDTDNSNSNRTIEVNENSITIDGNTIPNFLSTYTIGGSTARSGNIAYNKLTINGGNFTLNFAGGSYTGNLINNQIMLKGGTLSFSNIADSSSYSGTIQGNLFSISGGNFSNTYNFLPSITATNNTVEISGNANISNAYLFGGILGDASTASNNTLNIRGIGYTAQNIYDFDTLNFYIPASAKSGDTMLTLTSSEGTDISGARVNAGVQGGSTLDTGDTVTLITNPNGLNTNGTTYGTLSEGVSLNYKLTVEKSGDNSVVARIGDTTTDDSTPSDSSTDTSTVPATVITDNNHTLPQTELLGLPQIATLKLVDFMSDKLVDWLPPCSFDFEDEMEDEVNLPDVPQKEPKGYEIFITGSGGSFRTKTGNGSYIESTLKGFDVGFGRSIDYSNGRLVFAPIFEYAAGDYDSYLDDGMHGKGNTKYMAGGLIGRKTFKSGFYVEASARGGKTERDFSSDTMTSNGSPVFVHYDKTSAPVFAGHLRLGRQLRLNKNNLLDYYGIYFHSHQGGMNVNLSTGENYRFSSATSSRTRLGYRLTTRTSKISRIYTGLAFQYEHNPNVVGIYKGRITPNAGSCGASGMLEFGWMIRPNKDNPWMLDLNATGFVGLQRGLSGTIKLQKEF